MGSYFSVQNKTELFDMTYNGRGEDKKPDMNVYLIFYGNESVERDHALVLVDLFGHSTTTEYKGFIIHAVCDPLDFQLKNDTAEDVLKKLYERKISLECIWGSIQVTPNHLFY